MSFLLRPGPSRNGLTLKSNDRLKARQGLRLRGATARTMEAADIFQQIFHGQVSQDIQGILPTPLVAESTDSGLLVRALQVFQAGLANRLCELKFFSSGGHFCWLQQFIV